MKFSSGPVNFFEVLIVIAVLVQLPLFVSSHGRLMEPPSRASLWRFKEFADLNPPVNYGDNGLNCRNSSFDLSLGGKCGICGDSFDRPIPRPHEDGGKYGRGIIVRGYWSGQTIPIEVELTTNHRGYFEFRLCANNDKKSHLDQRCYDKHLLRLADSSRTETRYYVPSIFGRYFAKYKLKLPDGVSCKHCVLQWHYQTGNRWGYCKDGTMGLGCGAQEVFRSCSDIIIYPLNWVDPYKAKIKQYPTSSTTTTTRPQQHQRIRFMSKPGPFFEISGNFV